MKAWREPHILKPQTLQGPKPSETRQGLLITGGSGRCVRQCSSVLRSCVSDRQVQGEKSETPKLLPT